jgi:hypothetical protein
VFTADLAASFCGVDSTTAPGGPYFGSAMGFGGADRARTDDPLLAKQVLSQLSYSPGPRQRNAECLVLNVE